MARILDGIKISQEIRLELSKKIVKFYEKHSFSPKLAVILTGNDPASHIYVKKKQEACQEVGIDSVVIDPLEGNQHDPQIRIEWAINNLSMDDSIHGILVQLPLPEMNYGRIFDAITPLKDVDVFNPFNVGLLVHGRPRFKPCTPHAIQQMLYRSNIPIAGKHIAVINRSDVVGKPLSSMLIQDNDDFANATVTLCHDKTPPKLLRDITKTADIVVVAVGIPRFLTPDMIKPKSVVIDVGVTKIGKKICGDADPAIAEVASAITKPIGGIGPVTVTMLLENTLKAAEMLNKCTANIPQ